jgi:hypothetical protein
MFRDEDGSNVLRIKGKRFFFERGREQRDGSITGSVFEMLPENTARKVGTFKISEDGTVERFPGLSAADRKEAENTMHDMRARNPRLLSSWGIGII